MGALFLPVGVNEALDAKRSAFLRNGSDKTTGAKCLVAWENVCKAKEDGGLGIKRLDTQNACLLIKLIHKLHHPGDSSWAAWARGRVRLADLQGDVAGPHWEAIRELLPAYRSISHVRVGNGEDTSFWLDRWLTSSTQADAFPSLHSHFTKGDASVHTVLNGDWRSMLQSRLSPQAEDELDQLRHLLHEVTLEATPDDRICVFAKHDGKLAAGMIYTASIRGEQKLPSFDFVWRNFAPPRVKFFAWLLVQDRI